MAFSWSPAVFSGSGAGGGIAARCEPFKRFYLAGSGAVGQIQTRAALLKRRGGDGGLVRAAEFRLYFCGAVQGDLNVREYFGQCVSGHPEVLGGDGGIVQPRQKLAQVTRCRGC